MDDIKLIIEVEKYSELYDPWNMLYKDNTKKDKCWDAVAVTFGATSICLKKNNKMLFLLQADNSGAL